MSDTVNGVVDVFNYPTLSLAGQLTGLPSVFGLCANPSNGDVYVTDQLGGNIFGFHHGAPTSFITLSQGIAGT
ncbi:MAG: hypothetical protein WCD38_13365, partial [Candidatus Tumulicola sp.]